MIKVGIIGVGAIGRELVRSCLGTFKKEVRLMGIVDKNAPREREALKAFGLKEKFTRRALIRACDLVIECASSTAAYGIAREALSQGKDVMLMSSGGILDRVRELGELARKHGASVYVPSGAIAGLDGLKSAQAGRVRHVELITRKSPSSLEGAPYLVGKKIRLDRIHREKLVFDGSAHEAVKGFPQNINVAATLSLAGLGPRRTRVKIYACPQLKENVHEIFIRGDFGTIHTRVENRRSRRNPKTSELAVLSAIATLRRILDHVKVGT